MLTPEQIAAREGKLTASRVACLMTGDKEKILNLWRELVGDPAFVAEDLSEVWPVRLGEATEQLNLDWYELKHGAVFVRGGVVTHPKHPWAAATLDGMTEIGPIECKNVGGFEKYETVLDRYMPQLHWQMIVAQTERCVFSVIEGAKEPRVEIIQRNDAYAKELWARAEHFMECVRLLRPPVDMPAVKAPVVPTKTVDMTGNNAWADAVARWLEHKAAAKEYDNATVEIKELVPEDAVSAFGHGVSANRDKRGHLRVVERK